MAEDQELVEVARQFVRYEKVAIIELGDQQFVKINGVICRVFPMKKKRVVKPKVETV